MFYLTTHSTHFIYDYTALDMVKDNSDSERENPLLHLLGLILSISSNASFICTIPQAGWHKFVMGQIVSRITVYINGQNISHV